MLATVDTLLLGRTTYESFTGGWPGPRRPCRRTCGRRQTRHGSDASSRRSRSERRQGPADARAFAVHPQNVSAADTSLSVTPGYWLAVVDTSLTFLFVSSSRMSRASGSDRASRSSLVTTNVSPTCHRLGKRRGPTEARVGLGSRRSSHGRRRCDRRPRRARAIRCAGR
jgi:hypothetical protein